MIIYHLLSSINIKFVFQDLYGENGALKHPYQSLQDIPAVFYNDFPKTGIQKHHNKPQNCTNA